MRIFLTICFWSVTAFSQSNESPASNHSSLFFLEFKAEALYVTPLPLGKYHNIYYLSEDNLGGSLELSLDIPVPITIWSIGITVFGSRSYIPQRDGGFYYTAFGGAFLIPII